MAKRIYYETLAKNTKDNSRIKISDLKSGDNKTNERVQAALDATSDYRANMNAWAEEQRQKDRLVRQRAIELAKNANAKPENAIYKVPEDERNLTDQERLQKNMVLYGDNKANAGNDRTTEVANNRITTMGLGTIFDPQKQGINTAANGADVDSDKFKTEATTQNGWKGLGNTAVGKQIKGNGVTEEQSLAHAKDVMNRYSLSDKAISILDEYVAKDDESKRAGLLRFEGQGAYSGTLMSLGDKFKAETGVSDEEFRNIYESYSRLKHSEQRQAQQQEYADMSTGERIVKSIVKAPKNVLGGYQGLIGSLQNPSDPELGRDYNSEFFRYSNENTDIRNAQNEAINQIENPVLKTMAHFGYNAAVMGAESATAALTGEVGLGSFFAGGYNQGLKDAEDRGLTPEQAQAYALSVGGLEYFTERIPWEGLRNIYAGNAVSKDVVKGSITPYIKALLKQSGEEAGEEVINGIGETIADALIAGDKSNLNISIQNYQAEGLSEEDATRKAIWDVVKETADAAITAALSAGASAGPALAGQAYSVAKAGRNIADYENQTGNLTRNAEQQTYIPDTRDSYFADEDYDQAQETRQAILAASEKAAKGERISGREARALYESYTETAESIDTAKRARAIEQIERRQEAAKETALKAIENTTSVEELETIKEKNVRNEAVVAAVEEKEAQMIEQGATTQEEIENAITPRKAFEQAKEGNVIEEEKLENLPVETKLAYQYGKEAANDIKGSDLSDVDISSIENKKAKPGKRVQKIKDVKVNQKNELVFTTEDGSEIIAYEANYTDKGKQVYKGENGILSLNKPSLVKIAMEAVEQGNYTGAISNLTTAIKTMDTLGRTQGINFEDALKSYGYMQEAVGRDILEQAFNANREESKVFDEVKKVGRVKKSNRGLVREQTADNEAAFTSQFGNKDIETLLKKEHIAYSNQNTEEAIRAFEDLSDTQKDFLDSFSSRTGVDFDFIYAKEGGIRGTYAPSTGKIILNLAYSNNMFEVALHEGIGEFLQAHNAKAYNAISESILNYYASTQADKLAEKIRNYQRTYKNLKYRESANELVNDALGQIFSTDEGLKELTRWLDENETAAQSKKVKKTFLDYFNDFRNMIKDIKSKGGLKEGDAKALSMAEKDAAKFAKKLTAAMNEAITTRDAQAEIAGVAEEGNDTRFARMLEKDEISFITPSSRNLYTDKKGNIRSDRDAFKKINGKSYKTIDGDVIRIEKTLYETEAKDVCDEFYRKRPSRYNGINDIDSVDRYIKGHIKDFIENSVLTSKEEIPVTDHSQYGIETFDERTVGFIFDNESYVLRFIVANMNDGRKVLYAKRSVDSIEEYIKQKEELPLGQIPAKSSSENKISKNKNNATPNQQKSAKTQNKGGGKSLDVDGNTLSAEQAEYFKDSKVVDDNGNLMVVYHGSPNEFTEFSHDFIGTTGAAEGKGFYFTNNKSMAEGYSRKDKGQILKGYLNITKPLSSDKITVKKQELKKFLTTVDPTGDEILSDYDSEGGAGYPSKAWYNRALNDTINAMMQFNENDADLAAEIFNMLGKDGLLSFKEILGYDGFIVKDKYPDAEVYVAFDSNQYKNIDNTNPTDLADFRFSFAGLASDTADMEAVTEADNMRAEGKSMEEIFAKTGWYLGNDDKWRYEISNKDAKLYLDGDALLADTKEHKRYRKLVDYINSSNDMDDEWMKAFDEVGKYIDKHNIGSNKKEYRLEEVLKHDELFKAYPSLRRVKVAIVDLPAGTNGRFNPKTNTIEISDTLKRVGQNPLRKTLFHELQHVIQKLEDFAGGSSPEFWNLRGLPQYTKEEDIKAYEEARKKVDDLRKTLPENFLKKYDKYTELMREYSGQSTNLDLYESAQRLYKLLQDENKAALDELDDAYWEMDFSFPTPNEMLATEAYYATAGEIEAREVSDRIDMTEEERRANLPKMTDINGRVVFAENATTPWRYPTGDDFRFSKSVDSDGNQLSMQQEELFKDSKAVDKSGNLLVLYHGSQSAEQFNEFKLDTEAVNGRVFGDGFYFTPYENVAKFWGDQNVYKVYLNLTKPFYATETSKVPKDVRDYIDKRVDEIRTQHNLSKPEGRVQQAIDKAYRHYIEARNGYSALGLMHAYGIKNELKLLGYDGVIVDDRKVERGAKQYVAFYPEQIKRTDNYNPTAESADIRKSIEVKFDEDTIDIPARDYDDMIFFTGSDEEIEAAEKQDLNVMAYFANIIQSKGFNGLMFSWESDWGKSGKHIEQRYVTKSTREGEDWHLSEGRDGEPLGHTWYANKNDKIELYNHNNHDLSSLYSDLLQNTPKEGVKVYVLRDATESNARYSKAVFGEESQYSSQLEQTQFVSQVLSTLNNQLKGTSVSPKYIEETVKYILDKYDADLNPDDFKMELSQFIAYMTANEQVDYNQMMNYLLNVGDEVIQASRLKDPEEERIYSELKKELSSHKINLTEVERKELISKYGGSWNAVFGKLNAAGIKLNNAGNHMDGSIYSEIVERFREIAGVQLDEEKTAVDQIATILDAMDVLKPSAYQWEGATDMDKALDVATTIIDRYYSMATAIKEANIVKGTEKGAAAVERAKKNEIKKLRAKQEEYKAKVNEEFQQLVEDRKKVIQEQQEFYRRQAEIEKNFRGEKREFNKKANMTSKELEKTARLQAQIAYQGLKDTEAKKKNKDNIVRTCMRLINWMNKPTDTRHVPTFIKPALSDMIKSINFMPASMRKGDDGTISAIKWQESMRKLQQVLQGISNADAESLNDSDKYELSLVMEVDEIVNKMQQLLDKYNGTADISRMRPEDLKTLSDIMTSISKGISQMNENFMNRRFKHVSDAAKASMNEMNELKPISNTMGAVKSTLSDFLNLDMAEPITFFEELGSASESIMQEFFDGEKIGIEIIKEADNFFDKISKDLGLTTKDLRAWENDAKEYKFGGVPITLTSADLMSLYCSYNREKLDQEERPFEATHHIAAGGIKGFRHRIGFKEVNRNPQVAHVNEAEVLRLLDNLTETQKKYADLVVGYMSTTLAEHGNKTSNKLNGYSKFLGKYYFPLKTDNNAIATTESNNTSDQAAFRRLIFPSFTKSQIDKADNALVIMNFFDVVTEHITGMSNYCAYAMPISDAMRWYNYAETERANTDEENQYQRYTTSVKGSMDRVRGDEARKYFENFIRDVNLDNKPSGSKASRLIAQGLTGLAKAKAVGLNIRVIVQQPCAIIRAADVIEGKYLAEGWAKMSKNPKAATEYAQSNSYLCYWKSKGFSDTRISQSMKEIITGQESIRQDIVEKTGALAGLADDITWASMYYAAEEKIKATTNFEEGSEEFNTAVEELFSNIINHTQVIDSQLRKTGTMRSNDAIEKLANAFKKEPQKSYNMLHRAYWKVYQDPTNAEAKKGWQRAVTIFVENAFVTAIAQSLVDAWRDEDDENYFIKMLKKMLPYESFAAIKDMAEKLANGEAKPKDALNLIQGIYGGAGNILDNANIASSIPYVADIDSMLKGYSVTRLDSTSILTQLKNTVTALGSSTATPYSMIYSIAQLLGYATGIGADNALRDLRGIYNQAIGNKTGHRIEKNATAAKKNAKIRETNRVSEVFDAGDLSAIKAEVQNAYQQKIDEGKEESEGWKASRDILKEQYQRMVGEHPEDKAAITNRFKTLLKYTKKADGKGGYRALTDKEIQNYIDGCSAAE